MWKDKNKKTVWAGPSEPAGKSCSDRSLSKWVNYIINPWRRGVKDPELPQFTIQHAQLSTKNCKVCRETGKHDPYMREKADDRSRFWRAQLLDLADRDFKTAIINTFKEQREPCLQITVCRWQSLIKRRISVKRHKLERTKWKLWSWKV